jgi:hypothetical protein
MSNMTLGIQPPNSVPAGPHQDVLFLEAFATLDAVQRTGLKVSATALSFLHSLATTYLPSLQKSSSSQLLRELLSGDIRWSLFVIAAQLIGSGLFPSTEAGNVYGGQSRYRGLTDIVAAGDAALRLARCKPLSRLPLLVQRHGGLAAELATLRLGVGPAPCGAFENAVAFQLRGNAKNRENGLGKLRGRIEERLGQ